MNTLRSRFLPSRHSLFIPVMVVLAAAGLFFHISPAHAAVTIDSSTPLAYLNGSDGTATHFASGTHITAIAFLWVDHTSDPVTYGGSSMTLVASTTVSTTFPGSYYEYILPNAPAGTSTVAYGSLSGQIAGMLVTLDGTAASQPDAIGTHSTGTLDGAGQAYLPITTVNNNSMEIGMYGEGSCGMTANPSSNGTYLGTVPAATDYVWYSTVNVTPAGPFSLAAKGFCTPGQAYDALGLSISPFITAPGAPQSLVATPSNLQVTLNWSAPVTGDLPTSYLVYDKLTASSTYTFYASTTAITTNSTVSGLTNGISYDFQVVASNGAGTSTPASVTSTPAPGVPNPPQFLTATAANAQVALSWTTPSSNGGSAITNYLVYDKLTASSTYMLYATTTPSQTTSTITSLTNNVSYSFQVVAQNALGTSTPATVTSTPTNDATSTTGGGNWSATSTWVGGIVPGDGYFVTIQGPVTIDQNLGTVGGGGIKTITVIGASSVLTVNTSSPRTILFGSTGTDPIGSGSASNPGANATMFGFIGRQNSRLFLVGTKADPVTINSANGTSPIYIHAVSDFSGTFLPPGNLRMVYNDVYNLGTNSASSTADFPGIDWNPSGSETSSSFIDIENSRFTNPYNVLDTSELTGTITFNANYITGRSGLRSIYMFNGSTPATGTIVMDDNTEVNPAVSGYFVYSEYSPINISGLRNALFGSLTHYMAGFQLSSGQASPSSTLQFNLLYNSTSTLNITDGTGGGHANSFGGQGNGLIDSNIIEGAYTALGGGSTESNNFITGGIATPNQQGLIFIVGSAGNVHTTVSNNIVMHYPQPDLSGVDENIFFYNATSTDSTTVQHNTIIGASPDPVLGNGEDAFSVGDSCGSGDPQYNVIIRSNLMGNISNGICDLGLGPNHYTADFDGVGLHHNDVYQAGNWPYPTSTSANTNFDDGVHIHPNAVYGDVSTAPNFIDTTRMSITNYDSRVLSGPGTAADLATQLGYRSGWPATSTYTLGTNLINNMREWLFAGWEPTNAALAGTGADGQPDGAEGLALSITPTTLPNGTTTVVYSQTLTASGDFLPYTWSVVSGTLPTGLSLATSSVNTTTTISGTPTVGGTSNFTVQVQGNSGATTTQAYSITVGGGVTVPSAPQSLSAVPSNTQVALTWVAPVSNGGSAITQYIVYDRFTGSSTFNQIATTSLAQTTSTVTSLTNGQGYDFEIIAQNSIGTSTASSIVTSTPFTVPNAPTGATAVAGNAQATISWSAPGFNGGSAITLYTIVSSPGNFTATSTTVTPTAVVGLGNGIPYTFTVFATNAAGNSVSSTISNSVTPSAVPAAPTGVVGTPGNGQVSVAFTPGSNGGSSILFFTATASSGGFSATSSGSPTIVSGLSNGTSYSFVVTATNINGTSASSTASASVTPFTVPNAPTGATAVAGNAQATISWSAPGFNGGSAITLYTITSNPGGVQATSTTVTPTVVPNLTNGLPYTFTVIATNVAGNSTSSAASNSVTPTTSPTPPSAPQSLSAVPSNTQVALTWVAPVSNGGSAITQYIVYDRFTGSSTFNQIATTSLAQTTSTVTSLTNGQGYDFEIIAQNSIGTSTASSIVTSTPFTVPNAPTGATAVAGNAQATITFTPPVSNGGSSILYYTAFSSPSNISATSTVSPIVVPGLVNNQAYTFVVTAKNAAGNSVSSTASNSVTPSAGAPVITAFTATSAFIMPGQSSTLAWTTSGAVTVSINNGIGSEAATSTGSVVVTPTSTLTYTISANNVSGTSTLPVTVTVDGTSPSAPTSVAASAVSTSEIDLSWASSTDTGGSGLAGYDIYQNGVKIATTSLASYQNTGLSASTLYTYFIDAFDNSLNVSGTSTSVSATTQSAPPAPSGGGGGGGGGGFYEPPVTPTPSDTGNTTSSDEVLLNTLVTQLQALIQQANNAGIPLPAGAKDFVFPASWSGNPATTGGSGTVTTSLSYGDDNAQVTALQQLLSTNYPSLYPQKLVTGYFGGLTLSAVEAFQLQAGIVTSSSTPGYGIVGPRTRAALFGVGSVPTDAPTNTATSVTTTPSTTSSFTQTLSLGSTGDEVSLLQRFLAEDPLTYPQGTVTGYYGALTAQAVQTFQITEGIVVPNNDYGTVDAATLAKLNALYTAGQKP